MNRTRIWVPESEIIAPQIEYTEIGIPVDVSGHFIVDLIDAKTGRVKQHLEFSNVLTNGLLDALGTGDTISTIFNGLEVGTGGVAGVNSPNVANTSLVAPIGFRSSGSDGFSDSFGAVTASAEGWYCFYRKTRVFDETKANGNLSELGFWNSLNTILVNRTAFKDNTGTAISLTKTSNDILRIIYEYRMYPQMNDVTGSIVLSGSTYNYTMRAYGITDGNGWLNRLVTFGNWVQYGQVEESGTLVSPTASVTSGGTSVSTTTLASYVGGNYYRDFELTWQTSSANFPSGIQLLKVGSAGSPFIGASLAVVFNWQFQFAPKIPKVSGQVLNLGFRLQFQQKTLP